MNQSCICYCSGHYHVSLLASLHYLLDRSVLGVLLLDVLELEFLILLTHVFVLLPSLVFIWMSLNDRLLIHLYWFVLLLVDLVDVLENLFSDFLSFKLWKSLRTANRLVGSFVFLMKGLEHVGDVLLDNRGFVRTQLYFLELLFQNRMVWISQNHAGQSFPFFDFNCLEELVPRSELGFQKFFLFSIFSCEFEVLDSVVFLKYLRSDKRLPHVLKVIVVSTISKVEQIGNESVQNENAHHRPHGILLVWGQGVELNFVCQDYQKNRSYHNHVVNYHLGSELFPGDADVRFLDDQVNRVKHVDQNEKENLDHRVLVGRDYEHRNQQFVPQVYQGSADFSRTHPRF